MEDIKETNENKTENTGVDYSQLISAMEEMKKQNAELNDKYQAMENSNKELQKTLADKMMSNPIQNKNEISTKDLYKKVVESSYANDREFVKDALTLRTKVLEETGKDIFAPTNNVGQFDLMKADGVANKLQALVDTYEDPITFKAQFLAKTQFDERKRK